MQASPVEGSASLLEHDREIQWPQTSLRATVYNAAVPGFAATETTDVLALTCWLHRDALIAKVDALIAEGRRQGRVDA